MQKCWSFFIILCGAAGALHACWVVWKLPTSGTRWPWASLYLHQPLQHRQADNHSVGIAMGDHHVWGEGNPARDGDGPETGLTYLGSGNGLQSCGRVNNNMVVPFRQTFESRRFLWVKKKPNPNKKPRNKSQLLLPEVLCCLVDVVWSADVYSSWKSVETLNVFSAQRGSVRWNHELFEHIYLCDKISGKCVEKATESQSLYIHTWTSSL